ncbi:hypothetical protein IFR05_014543 [Cadophora sp. M221]|nr:hypothetical protein IFR05_014543 [Cadophora sp. M221]
MTARLTKFISFSGKKSPPKPPHQPYGGLPDINITDADLEKAERNACTQYLLHRVQVRRERAALHRWIDRGQREQDDQQQEQQRERNREFPHGLGDGPEEQERRERQETHEELKSHGFRFGFGAEGEILESPSYTDVSAAASNWTPGSRISPGNVGHPSNLVEKGASSAAHSSVSNPARPSPLSVQSAPAPLAGVIAHVSHEPSNSVAGTQMTGGNGTGVQQRDEKEIKVNGHPNESASQMKNVLESKDILPSSGPQTIPEGNIPNARPAEVAAPMDSYFFQNPNPETRPEPVPIPFASPPPEYIPQRPRPNTDQLKIGSPQSFHTALEQMQILAPSAAEPNERASQTDEEHNGAKSQSRSIHDQCCTGSEREAVHTPLAQSGTSSSSDKGDARVSETDAYKPKAHSTIDYKQVLRDTKVSDRSEDLKFDMAIELVGLLQEHKVRLLEEKAESEAEKQTQIDGWENYYRTRTLEANLTYLHPNDLLIQGYELLREDIPFIDFVVNQLKQGRETTNKARLKLQKLQKDRKLSQAPTLIGNEDSSSNGSESPKQARETRTVSQSLKSIKTSKTWVSWRKLSVSGWWPSIKRNTKARSSIIDARIFREDAPQRPPAQPVPGSGVGTSNANASSSIKVLHSSHHVPATNPELPINGQNAESGVAVATAAAGTCADTADLHTNGLAAVNGLGIGAHQYFTRETRSSESVERLARDGNTFAGFSTQPSPSERLGTGGSPRLSKVI